MTGEIFSAESFLWSCLWQSTIFLAAGLLVSFLFRRHSARAHRVLFLAMIATVIVPAASLLVNHYELGIFVAEPAVIQPPSESRAIHETTIAFPNEVIEYSPASISQDLQPAMTGSKAAKFPWRSTLLYAWIAASLILVARLLVTFALGIRLLGRSSPLQSENIEQAVHLAKAKLGINKDVKVYSSSRVHSPVIWCWKRRPVLLVPSAAGQSDNGIDWAGVLCHELAHYKRRDHVAGLLVELTVCILPWHPLLWWAKSRLITLSEQACDDWVVASGRPGTDYAESLLNLTPEGQMAFVPAVVSSKRGLAGRVHRILKDSCGNPRTGAVWALAVSIAAICLAAGIAFAQTRPVKSQVPGKRQADELDQEQPDPRKLPVGWSLDYDDGLLAGGGRHWPANMAKDLASLEIRLKLYDPFKASLKGEKYEFWIFSLAGEQIGNIHVRPESDFRLPSSKIFKPGKYALKYRRRWGPSGDNFRMECGEYPIDLSRPGMYELTFTPKIGTAEITGTLGGCYAINFEKVGKGPRIRGYAYQYPGKQYTLDGLPPGKYRLSAVSMHESPNVFVSQAEVTVGAEDKAIVNIVPVPIGNCSLKGNILGKQKKYKTPWPDQWPESEGKWYVLIRKRGSNAVGSMEAYEALTMDSLYVIRSGSIVQQTQDRAQYHIEGVAPGQYTVTAIEHPSWGGCTVTRQLSKNLTLKAGEDAVLDFDLQIVPEHNYDTGAKADSEEAAGLIKVTGLVKDPQGRPVSGASVTLFQTKLEYITDAEGKFQAVLAPSDKMRYFFAVHKQRKLVASGRLAEGKQRLEIKLVPAVIVSGRVVDPNGRPVSGAQVAPLPMTCFHVLTDSEGRFDVGWSPEWAGDLKEFCLMARHQELNLAGLAEITESTKTANIQLEPALALTGTVEDPNGTPIPKAQVSITLRGAGTPVKSVLTDDQGRFELSALPQRQEYGIGANAEGYVPNAIKTGVINNITEREKVGPVILDGAPHQDEGKAGLGRLLINVVDEDGKAVGIDSVLIWNKTDDGGSRGYSFPAVATDKQGFYEIRNVPVGKHQAISVDKEGFARLKKFDIEVREDRTEAITCVLSRGGIIEGFVTDEQNNPVVGVPVVINSTTGQGTKNLTTDENGHFIATHVADGRHSVYAHPPAGSPYEIQRVKGGVLCGTKDVHIVFKKREEAKNIRSAAGPGFEPKDAGQDIQETKTASAEGAQDSAVNEGKVKLCLFDTSGKPVIGAKVGTSVRTRDAAFLGSRLSWTLRGRENNVSNERGEIELTRKNLFLDWWPEERKAALYVLHEERKIGAFCEISKNDSHGEIPLTLEPVCHVHGKLGSKEFEQIGWPLRSGNVDLKWNGHNMLNQSLYRPGKEMRFELLIPAGEYELRIQAMGANPDRPYLSALTQRRTVQIKVEQGQSELDLGTVNAPASKLADLIGKPAPEFGPLQWMNGPATTLSELKGKVVLLYFGLDDPNPRLGFSELIELHNQFADNGLKIIAIYNCKSMKELKDKWAKAHKEPGLKQGVPFRVALDGGESTFVGDFERLGSMHGTYDITEPVTILIEPTGTVAGILNVRQPAGVIRDMLGIGPIEWRKRFDDVYRLEDEQILKRIAPPFIPERKEYFVNERPSQAERYPEGPAMMIFHWRDNKANLSYTLDHHNFSLSNLVQYIFKIGSPDMWWGDTGNYSGNPDGPEQLLGMKLPGDWILRNEAPPEVKIQALEKLIADEFGRNITIRNSIEQRDVIVATGQFKISLVHSDEAIVMFADEDESVREKGENIVSGTNTIAQFLQQLGWLVSVPVIDRTEITEDTGIEYRAHLGHPSLRRITDMSEKKDKLRFFLDTLSAQTNLQFEITREPIEVWFVTEETEN